MKTGMQVLEFTHSGTQVLEISDTAVLKSTLKRRGSLLWLDLCGVDPIVSENVLEEVFKFHPLVIEDALAERHSPKADDWDGYLYLVLRTPDIDNPDDSIEVDILLGDNYLITHSSRSAPAVRRAWGLALEDARLLGGGAVGMLKLIVNEIVDDFLILLDTLDNDVEALEERLFADPGPDLLERSFALKRTLLHLRRFLGPQRDVLSRIARGDFRIIPKNERIYFRDAADHFVRLEALCGSLIDLVVAARDTYLSVLNNRMNDIVRILTIVTALFMPLAFVTGFFGMNFFQPLDLFPGWTGQFVFGLVLVSMIAIPFGMLAWMRRRGWW